MSSQLIVRLPLTRLARLDGVLANARYVQMGGRLLHSDDGAGLSNGEAISVGSMTTRLRGGGFGTDQVNPGSAV